MLASLTFARLFYVLGVFYATDAASFLLFVVLTDAGFRTAHRFVHWIRFDGHDGLRGFLLKFDLLLDNL